MRLNIPAVIAVSAALSAYSPAKADAQFDCYADVHDGCFLHKPHCTQEEYEALLDSCEYFGTDNGSKQSVALQFPYPSGLQAEGLTPQRRAQILRLIRRHSRP